MGGWGLPPTQLHNAHFHSGLIGAQFSSAVDDANESVGSASADADNHEYEDSSDSEEQGSGRFSLDFSPENVPLETKDAGCDKAACGAADNYYYEYDRRLLSAKSNSKSNSMCNSRRESFGPLEGRPVQQTLQKVRPPHESVYPYEGDSSTVCNRGDLNGRFSDGETRGDVCKFDVDCEDTGKRIMRGRPSHTDEHSKHKFCRADEVSCTGRVQFKILSDESGVPPSAPPMMAPSGTESGKNENHASFPGRLDQSFNKNSENGFSRASKASASFTFEDDERGHYEGDQMSEACTRGDENASSIRQAAAASQPPPIQLSAHAAWPTIIAYEACVRLCLQAWSRGCVEATQFLHNECSVLRNSFGLKHVLLQTQEDASQRLVAEDPETLSGSKPRKDSGKIRVQVRKVRLTLKTPSGCSFRSLDGSGAGVDLNVKPAILAGWENMRKWCNFSHRIPRSTSSNGAGYMQAGAQYMRQVSSLLKAGVSTLRSSTLMDAPQEMYTCVLRLKSMAEEDSVRMQPGSGDSHIFHPENPGDDLILEVHDSKGSFLGRGLVHLVSISDDQNDRVRWWSVHNERDQECVGKVQLFINYTLNSNSARLNKLGVVSETLAYDIVLESAMRMQEFQQKNLRLYGSWKWLLSEFASYYGVSDAYTKLRYLSCVMEVATPTEDCLLLIHDLLSPVVGARQGVLLSHQEKRMLLDVQDQVEQLLALLFENYKSLEEASPSGMTKFLTPVAGNAAPALVPAVQLYTLLHDILSLEAQTVLHNHFQAAAKKRWRRYAAETDEFVSSNNEGFLMDTLTISGAYSKMKTLCINLSNEVQTDIEIHNQHILPSSIDLPNIVAAIYSVELCNRLRTFLVACPPSSPSPPVTELLLATADFQRNLAGWNISPIKGGVDTKDLFHLYIVLWIQDKRMNLLDFCKLDKVRWTGITTPHGTSPFVEEMYDRIRETLNEYDVLLNRWPEYAFHLERAVADVETATIAALEKQYADVLNPLKDVMVPKKFSLQYMQKLTRRRSLTIYSVPNQLGIFLNTIKRSLDTLRPKIEIQMKSWVACLPAEGNEKAGFGEGLNEVTVILRAKYKNFLQAIVEKLVDNACMQRMTRLKKILEDTREAGGESEIRDRMQLLSSQLMDTIRHLHDVFSSRVFVAICRGYWDRMGQDVLHFLGNRKENRSWYKGSYFALAILDDLFASQMQKLLGHALQEKDLEPPRSVMEARSMLSKDAQIGLDDSNYLHF